MDWSASSDDQISARVRVDWTLPLSFAVIPLTETRQLGVETFEWTVEAEGWTWARVAVWDVAANGAFVNPTWR